MIETYTNGNYRITYKSVSMVENALGNPNLVQISVTSGCTIVVPGTKENKAFGLDYMPNGEARSWKLNGLNTRINKKEAHFIFARLDRSGDSALLMFSTNDYRIDGSVVDGEAEVMPASDTYYYIKVGSITATDAVGESATLDRVIAYDGGYYRTDDYNDTSSGGWGDMFVLTSEGLINALRELASFTVRGMLSVIGKIVLNEKQISDIARATDDSTVIDDETIPTTAYLSSKYLLELSKKFLRKDAEDRTPHKLSTDTAFEVGDFVSGSSGAIVYKDADTGQTIGELDKLRVRMKAYFESLEIVNVNSLGGKQVISPAGAVKLAMVCNAGEKYSVVTAGEDGSGVVSEVTVPQGVYRCFFLAEQDGQEVENRFKAGNQLQSKDFNVKKPGEYNQVANHYYWRLVTGVSAEPVRMGELGYHYVDLSVSDCDTGSDAPAKGDVVAQLGDRNDVDYQNALVFSSVDAFSPSITLYKGINSYSLVGKDAVSYGVDKSTGKAFMNVYGEMYIGDRGGNTFVKYTQDGGVEINGKLAVGTKIGDGKTIEQALDDATQAAIDAANENISEFTDAVTKDIEDLQNQIDGAIETWFNDPVPTLTNYPASEWTTDEEKNIHLGDLYYSGDGKAYRFQMEGGSYVWKLIEDSDITKALADAAKAQDTADGKRKVFVTQPTNADDYQVGDLWVNATYGTTYSNDVLHAVTAKAAGSPFSINHWTKSSKYTDDTKAEQVQQNVDNLSTTVNTISGTVSGMKDFTDTAFADGIIDRGEASAIEKYLNNINTAKADVQNAYGNVYANALLDGVSKTNLENAYNAFTASATELASSITNAIADGVTTSAERAAVDLKYTNFNTKYGDFIAYLNAANKHIQDKINATANNALTQIGGLAYLKQALKQDTTIEGGLIQSSVLALGYTNDGGVYKVMSGTNGIYNASALGGGIASWWGGSMKDRGNYTDANMPSDVAKAIIRMDGSGYLADGGIWWGTDKKIHADPQSFIINENQLGDYLELFQIIYKNNTKEIDYIIPQYVMQKLEVATSVKIGDVLVKKHANGVLQIDGDLLVTGGVTMYAQGSHTASTIMDAIFVDGTTISKAGGVLSVIGCAGGGASSLSELSDVLLSSPAANDLLKWNGTKWVNVPVSSVQGASSWSEIAGKPSWIGDSKPVYTFAEITGKPTTLAGYGISGYTWTCTGNSVDANAPATVIAGNYGGVATITNVPSGYVYGGLLTTYNRYCELGGSLSAQLIWDVQHGNTGSNSGLLWFRTKDEVSGWRGWQQVLTSNNGVTLGTEQTITGKKTFSNGLAITGGSTEKPSMPYFLGIDSFNDGGAVHFLRASYVCSAIGALTTSAAASTYVKKSGDTMSGYLYLGSSSANIFANETYGAWLQYGSNYINVKSDGPWWNNASKIWHASNDGSGSGLDADLLDGYHYSRFCPHSSYNFNNGVTVKTYVSKFVSKMLQFHITGNSYGEYGGLPIDTYVQLYSYSSSTFVHNPSMVNNGARIPYVTAFYYDNVVCLYIPFDGNYVSLDVYCQDSMGGTGTNLVQSLLNQDLRGSGTNAQVINPNHSAMISDNVASATKLLTARTIWGQSFDGTGNVSGWLSGATTIQCSTGLKSRNICIETDNNGNAGGQGSEINTFINHLYLQHSTANNLYCCNGGGKVGIGTTSPSYKLHVAGDVYANGGWLRTSGTMGWYNETYGGGWYMNESNYVRTYNNKRVYCSNTAVDCFNAAGGYYSSRNSSVADTWTNALNISSAVFGNLNTTNLAVNPNTYRTLMGWSDVISGVGYITRYSIGSRRLAYGWGGMAFTIGNDDNGTSGVQLRLWGSGSMEWTGNFLATGGITMYSDIRKKDILGSVNLPLEKICAAPLFSYTYKDDEAKTMHIGSSAQYWQDVPGIVRPDTDGKYLTMDYNAMLSAVALSLAKHTMRHETEIEKLKRENKQLKQRIETLERRAA